VASQASETNILKVLRLIVRWGDVA